MRFLVILLIVIACGSACTRGGGRGTMRSVEPREAAGLLRNDFAVLADAGTARLASLPKEKEIVFYGEHEQAQKAAQAASEQGYRAAWLQGEPKDWAAAGLPTPNP